MGKQGKKYLFLILMLMLLTLFSCQQKLVAGPTNIRFDYKTQSLMWDEVNKATYYLLDINGMLFEVEETTYSFKDSAEGLYKVKIKAIFKDSQSLFSNTISFVVSEQVNLLMYSDGNYLFWEDVDDAIYEISYLDNLSLKTVVVNENRFLIPDILKQKIHEITLKVFIEDRMVSSQKVTLDFQILRIYKNSPLILRAFNAKEVYINGKKAFGVSLSSNNIRISSHHLFNYSGENFVSIYGEENILKRILVLPEPYELVSFHIQPYVGEDIIYELMLKNYKIKTIEGLSPGKDYVFEIPKSLIIKKSFIDSYVASNPNITKIPLIITLVDGNFTEELYLEINLI